MNLKLAVVSLFALAAVTVPSVAHAYPCSFASHYNVQKVTYFSSSSRSETAWRCDPESGNCLLSGFVISKANVSPGLQPAIIFEHGSNGGGELDGTIDPDQQSIQEYACPIQRFVDAGYVVFYAYRRGVDDTTDPAIVPSGTRVGWHNTGKHAQEWAVARVEEQGADLTLNNYTGQYIKYLQMEADDLVFVMQTLAEVRRGDGTKLVDPARIAIAGHSMGGAFVTFASTNGDLFTKLRFGPKAFISLSGAAMSYHQSHWWPDILTSSAALNLAPLFFDRVLDEDARTPWDFASANEPFAAAGSFVGVNTMAKFSAVGATCPNDTPFHCQHAAFVSRPDQIDRWFPVLQNFLTRVGM